ncbi:unnamed protein product [Urochloa humidicola]
MCVPPLVVPAAPAPVSAEDQPATPIHRVLPDNLIVYTRSSKKHKEVHTPASEFIEQVTKKIDPLVPIPTIQKRRKKTTGPVSMPRRSRRIAMLPLETDQASAATVCRKLGLANDDGKITDECLDRYAKFYKDRPNRDEVAGLSALFGWAIPSVEELAAVSSQVVVA